MCRLVLRRSTLYARTRYAMQSEYIRKSATQYLSSMSQGVFLIFCPSQSTDVVTFKLSHQFEKNLDYGFQSMLLTLILERNNKKCSEAITEWALSGDHGSMQKKKNAIWWWQSNMVMWRQMVFSVIGPFQAKTGSSIKVQNEGVIVHRQECHCPVLSTAAWASFSCKDIHMIFYERFSVIQHTHNDFLLSEGRLILSVSVFEHCICICNKIRSQESGSSRC